MTDSSWNTTCEQNETDLTGVTDERSALTTAQASGLCLCLVVVVVVGSTGNLTMGVLVHRKRIMRSSVNFLIAFLSISHSLIALICATASLVNVIFMLCDAEAGSRVSNTVLDIVCRVFGFINSWLLISCFYTLLVITLDRYFIVVLKVNKLTLGRTKVLTVVICVVATLLSLPPAVGRGQYYRRVDGWIKCIILEYEPSTLAYITVVSLLGYYGPVAVMIYCFSRVVSYIRNAIRKVILLI